MAHDTYDDKTVRCPPPEASEALYVSPEDHRLLLDALEFYRTSLLAIEAQRDSPELSAVAHIATARVASLAEKIRSQR